MEEIIKIKSALVRCARFDVFTKTELPLINKTFIQKNTLTNEFVGIYQPISASVYEIYEIYQMMQFGMLYHLSSNLLADDYHFILRLQPAVLDDMFYSPKHLMGNVIYYVRETSGLIGPFSTAENADKTRFSAAIAKKILYVPCKSQNFQQIQKSIAA
jgi:hypothetical protein